MCERVLDLLMYLAHGSDEVNMRKPAPPWTEGRLQPLQFCPFICLVCCVLLHSVHHLCHLLSHLSCMGSLGTRPVCPGPSLWQSLRVGATMKSQCFPALTNNKDGRMGPRAQLEERDFHDGDKKDPQCFSLASEL